MQSVIYLTATTRKLEFLNNRLVENKKERDERNRSFFGAMQPV